MDHFIPVALDTYFRGAGDEVEFCQKIKAGGNHMAVAIEPAQGGTALVVRGTLPYHAGLDDFGQATIALTARCPG